MSDLPRFAAALVAGGRSRRMGQDKALLQCSNRPLWVVQMGKLCQLGAERVLLLARNEQDFDLTAFPEVELLADPPEEDAGPLPAIIRSLKHTQMPVLILAVDMPDMTSGNLKRELLPHLNDQRGACFAVAGNVEPLAAIYTPAMLPFLEAEGRGKGSIQRAIAAACEGGTCQILSREETDAPLFRNVNEPADLQNSAVGVELTRLSRGSGSAVASDSVAVEEPLEIRVEGRSVAVVMRTPGHDQELAAGFLVSEGVVKSARDIMEVSQCPRTTESQGNVVDVLLGGAVVNWDHLTRHVFSASSCGLCGKTSLDSVFVKFPAVTADWDVSPDLLWQLPERLRAAQDTFDKTGGLHACAVFDRQGNLVALREDVGRHNALDKLLGHALLNKTLPLSEHILLLSGRVSFEMMQKALAAGVAVVAAISAPTSLAVEFAKESGQTLVGFLRGQSMNIYAGEQRIKA